MKTCKRDWLPSEAHACPGRTRMPTAAITDTCVLLLGSPEVTFHPFGTVSRQDLSVHKPISSFTYLITCLCLSIRNHPFLVCFHLYFFLYLLLPFSCAIYVIFSFTQDFLHSLHSSLFLLFYFTRRYWTWCGPSDGRGGALQDRLSTAKKVKRLFQYTSHWIGNLSSLCLLTESVNLV